MSQIIRTSKIKNYFIEMGFDIDEEANAHDAINNYINVINADKIIPPKYLQKDYFFKSNKNKSWVICLPTVVKDKCNNNKINFKENILLIKDIPGIQMILIKK
jgi:hypothetical protein